MKNSTSAVLIILCILLSMVTVVLARGITAKEIIENVQSKYDDISDVVLTFDQTTRFKVSKVEQSLSGKLYFKKKNKYRIETEQRTIVTDGKTSWSYNPLSNQVVIDTYKEESHSLSPEQLLVKYPSDFFSTYVGEGKVGMDDCYLLKLTPKEDNSFTQTMKIWVNKKWIIRKVEVTDANGASTSYTIRDISIDKGISDGKFTFDIPKGAELIDLR